MKKVSILGCGWLGAALAKHLLQLPYEVQGSATLADKVKALTKAGIKGHLIKLDGADSVNVTSDFWTCDALVIASNVRLVGNNGYMEGLKVVAEIIRTKEIKRVIFVSSTSVYGDPNGIVDEDFRPSPETSSAGQLLDLEGLFTINNRFETVILRFGGLVGPGRMPGSFLSGKKDIPNGLAPVNLIHRIDCIGVITQLLVLRESPAYVNAVAPDHPTRQLFYTTAAGVQQLPLPQFILEKNSWKVVTSKFKEELSYEYQVSDWMRWLQNPI
jgi:nucleoside-diphosphate-sugar epimerase